MSKESPTLRRISYILVLAGLFFSMALFLDNNRRTSSSSFWIIRLPC
jgi:hypothetical protein